VILMARVIGMSHAEIAAELGIAEGAVRTRLSRALARLATRMASG
jgi:DNA-directed RNA polymerase specialized sigma24 family protein